MKPDPRFLRLPKSFWANVRTISQEVGYTQTADGYWKVPPGLTVPNNYRKHGGPRKNTVLACDLATMARAYANLGLKADHVIGTSGHSTELGRQLCEYFQYRANLLNSEVEPNLMDAAVGQARIRAVQEALSDFATILHEQAKGQQTSGSLPDLHGQHDHRVARQGVRLRSGPA